MKTKKNQSGLTALAALATIISATLVSPDANAAVLHAPTSGTFTMNLNRDALIPYGGGYYLSTFWNSLASDYSNLINTGDYLISQLNTTEISAVNRVFDLMAIGVNPTGQANQRFVKATSANFVIDSSTLAGVADAQIGMTGVQGVYAPNWPPGGAGLVNGDFSVLYDTGRQTNGRTGWYLANNIYFTMAVYELSNLSVAFTEVDNWRLSGDLLMSPENGGMLQGASLNKVGDFCLGAGSYAGCGQVTVVPVPGAVWLFITGLVGVVVNRSRKADLFLKVS